MCFSWELEKFFLVHQQSIKSVAGFDDVESGVKIIEINDRPRKRPFLNDKQLNRKPYWQNFRFPGHESDDLAQIVLLENLLQNSSTFVSNFPFEGQKVDRFTGKVIHANLMCNY